MSARSGSRSVLPENAGWTRAGSEKVAASGPGWREPFVVLMLVAACLCAVIIPVFGSVAVPTDDILF